MKMKPLTLALALCITALTPMMAGAWSKVDKMLAYDKKLQELHRSEIQRLKIVNETPDTLALREIKPAALVDLFPGERYLELPPGDTAVIEFEVVTYKDNNVPWTKLFSEAQKVPGKTRVFRLSDGEIFEPLSLWTFYFQESIGLILEKMESGKNPSRVRDFRFSLKSPGYFQPSRWEKGPEPAGSFVFRLIPPIFDIDSPESLDASRIIPLHELEEREKERALSRK
jgi:hypothetical protein